MRAGQRGGRGRGGPGAAWLAPERLCRRARVRAWARIRRARSWKVQTGRVARAAGGDRGGGSAQVLRAERPAAPCAPAPPPPATLPARAPRPATAARYVPPSRTAPAGCPGPLGAARGRCSCPPRSLGSAGRGGRGADPPAAVLPTCANGASLPEARVFPCEGVLHHRSLGRCNGFPWPPCEEGCSSWQKEVCAKQGKFAAARLRERSSPFFAAATALAAGRGAAAARCPVCDEELREKSGCLVRKRDPAVAGQDAAEEKAEGFPLGRWGNPVRRGVISFCAVYGPTDRRALKISLKLLCMYFHFSTGWTALGSLDECLHQCLERCANRQWMNSLVPSGLP